VSARSDDRRVTFSSNNWPENLWAQAVKASPLPTALLDRDGRYRFINRAYLRWFGWREEDVIGFTIPEVVGRSAGDAVATYVQMALGGGSVTFEVNVPYQLRGVRRMQVQYEAVKGEAGETVGFFAFLDDITDRKDAEEAVAAALDGLGDGYMAVNADLRFTYVNSAAARFYGRPREDFIGRGLDEVFPGARRTPTGEMLASVLRTGHPARSVLPSAGRPEIRVLIEVVPLKGGGAGIVIQEVDSDAPLALV
jgi:PAS domain S-box-containing protein